MNTSTTNNSLNSTRTSNSNKTTFHPLPADDELRKTLDVNTELLRTILSHVTDASKSRSELIVPPPPDLTELTKSVGSNFDLLQEILDATTRLNSKVEAQRTSEPKNSNDSSALDICHRFEKLNWESIDIINKKIDGIRSIGNSDFLDSIRSSLNDLDHKISSIESTIASMNDTPALTVNRGRPSASQDDSIDYTTQQMRERFQSILTDDHCLPLFPSNRTIPSQVNDDHASQSNNANSLPEGDSSPPNAARSRTEKHEFYVTKFSTNTTSDMIRDYMRDSGVPHLDSVKINCLIPRTKDRETLTFVSFKVDTVSPSVAATITKPGFWPSNCTIRTFAHKSITDLSQSNRHKSSNFHHHPGSNQQPL